VSSVDLSIIIPVYNENATVLEAIARVRAVDLDGLEREIVLVDDGSTDGSTDTLRNQVEGKMDGVRVVYHDVNRGKGAAIRSAIPECTGKFIVIQDADLEYDPRDLPALLAPLRDGRADVVFGTRFAGGPHRVMFFWHMVGNRFLTFLSNMLTNLNLSDMEVGYKVFRADILRAANLKSNRFGFEPEITAKVARRKLRIYEVPVSYAGRDYAQGKKITWRDGLAALFQIVRYRLFD